MPLDPIFALVVFAVCIAVGTLVLVFWVIKQIDRERSQEQSSLAQPQRKNKKDER